MVASRSTSWLAVTRLANIVVVPWETWNAAAARAWLASPVVKV